MEQAELERVWKRSRKQQEHIDHLWTTLRQERVRIQSLRAAKRKAELACDLWTCAAVIQLVFILWQYV